MPQWDFLDFVTNEAGRNPNFRLEMNAEVRELIEEGGYTVKARRHRLAERMRTHENRQRRSNVGSRGSSMFEGRGRA